MDMLAYLRITHGIDYNWERPSVFDTNNFKVKLTLTRDITNVSVL